MIKIPEGDPPQTITKLDRQAPIDHQKSWSCSLAALGVRSEVAERCLNHKLKGIEGVYNTHDYFDERRRALTQLANEIADIEHAKPKVVSLRRA